MVHDRDCGITRTLRKEQILLEIEAQLMNGDPLSEEDQYLLEINVGDMGRASGERQEYWLLAIQAARRAKLLRDQTPAGIG